MAIHAQQSISGFIASEPQLTTTSKGDPRLYLRFGQEHFRREEDGTFTQMETTYHHLVMFGRSAERLSSRFSKGDNFLAEGYVRPVNYEREGQAVESEEFVAKRMGHDAVRTRYDVDRSPRTAVAREAVQREQERAFDPPSRRPTASAPVLGR